MSMNAVKWPADSSGQVIIHYGFASGFQWENEVDQYLIEMTNDIGCVIFVRESNMGSGLVIDRIDESKSICVTFYRKSPNNHFEPRLQMVSYFSMEMLMETDSVGQRSA